MFKQVRVLLLVTMLAMSFAILFETEAAAATSCSAYLQKLNLCRSICCETLLKKLGNVIKDETVLNVYLNDFYVQVDCNNKGDQSPTAKGQAHFPQLSVCVFDPINPEEVSHNGTATAEQVINTDFIEHALNDLQIADPYAGPCVNSNWTWVKENGYLILGFRIRLELEKADAGMQHILEFTATLSDDRVNFDFVKDCDSQTKSPADCPTIPVGFYCY
jgi:hypothetical protein